MLAENASGSKLGGTSTDAMQHADMQYPQPLSDLKTARTGDKDGFGVGFLMLYDSE